MSKTKILVPLDGSEFSQQVLSQIKYWFRPEQVEIVLLNVAEPPRSVSGAYADMIHDEMARHLVSERFTQRDLEIAKHPVYVTQLEASIESNVKSELLPDEHLLEDAGFTVQTVVEFGEPAHTIIDYVKRHDIELVAMTTHGRTGISRLLMGSVAEQVLHHVGVPVLMVRPFAR